jgi:CheY-like chemotaxis protein
MLHILVADDNLLSLRFFADAISANAMRCATAADGGAAVELAGTRTFDMLLIDARMPILDGVQTLRSIREGNGPSRNSIAIATTAGDQNSHPELIRAGFAEVIGKPIDLANLRRVLQRHLGSKFDADSSTLQPLLGEMNNNRELGFDASIIHALRGLLSGELKALPAEIAQFALTENIDALRDRLHRLDASAGFCATPALAQASKLLRAKMDIDQAWPHTEIAALLNCSERTRAALL